MTKGIKFKTLNFLKNWAMITPAWNEFCPGLKVLGRRSISGAASGVWSAASSSRNRFQTCILNDPLAHTEWSFQLCLREKIKKFLISFPENFLSFLTLENFFRNAVIFPKTGNQRIARRHQDTGVDRFAPQNCLDKRISSPDIWNDVKLWLELEQVVA